MMNSKDVSAKFLIHLVGERPAIWDKTSDEYRDSVLRETSWREIFTFINENYEHMTLMEKAEFSRMIVRKWTHIRDSWVKSMKYGYDEKTMKPPKPYIYHDELQFLEKLLVLKPKRYDLSNLCYVNSEETENSIGKPNNSENNNVQEEAEVAEAPDNHDEDEIIKREIKPDHTPKIENNKDKATNDEDWPMSEADVTTITALNTTNYEHEQKFLKINPPIKEARKSIFLKSNCNGEYQDETQTAAVSRFQTKPDRTSRPYTYISFNVNKYLEDNRHLNFFKGVLPSISDLDEDHTLQFQSGVISLLQNLLESQKCRTVSNAGTKSSSFRSRERKRNISVDEDHERFGPTLNVSNRFERRSSKNSSDPIVAVENEDSWD